MNKLVFTLALAICFILFQSAGCNDVKELEYKGIENTRLQTLSLNNTSIRIDLKYFNPNKFGIDVKETNLNIYLNDKFIAVGDQPEKTQIPKKSDFIFPVTAHFDPIKVIGMAFKSLFSGKSKVGLHGTAKLGKGGVYIRVPVDIEEQVSLISN